MFSLRSGRFPLALALITLACASLAGCTPKPVVQKPTPISHADADDIVQTIGASISANNGGWYMVIKTLCDSLSGPAPLSAGPGPPTGPPNAYSISGGAGPIAYNMQVGYLLSDSTIGAYRDTSAFDMIADVVGTGPFINANGVDGTYWLAAPDSALFVSNLQGTPLDTLEFSGTFDDSCLALVHSTITAGSIRLWFHKNFVEFTLRIPKSTLVSAPYPVGPQSEIRWLIEAFVLRSENHNDWAYDNIVEISMSFDGTENAVLSLGDVLPDPSWVYYYKLNLNTGQITRQN